MKRYFILNGVAHKSKDGPYCKSDECFDIQASKDGLWLHCPDGESINLLNENKDRLRAILLNLWERLFEQPCPECGELLIISDLEQGHCPLCRKKIE